MTTFVDTNVLIAVLDSDDSFHEWSKEQLTRLKALGPIIISDIVYCELSIGMDSKEDVDAAVSELALERYAANDDALFRAGVAYKKYRSNKGKKSNVLPDFLIGAIAEVADVPLVTANPDDFGTYFPKIKLIRP